MISSQLFNEAQAIIDGLRRRGLTLATAESCTGGLITAILTDIPGSSDVVDRGFVTYSNAAKTDMLGVDPALLAAHGAVSREVALAMAGGALGRSRADLAVSVTGVAGPTGGTAVKPVGLVYLAVASKAGASEAVECRFGDVGRDNVRRASVRAAFGLVRAVAGLEGS